LQHNKHTLYMKIQISADELIKITTNLLPSVATASFTGEMESFQVEASTLGIHVTATNLETTIRAHITKCVVNEAGAVCIPAKMFTESIRALKGQDITIETDAAFGVAITSASGRYKIAGLSDEYFPAPMATPAPTDTSPIGIPAIYLYYAIAKTLPFASTDELRPQMCGINFDGQEAAATDANKLFHLPIQLDTASFIMPKKVAHLLKAILPQCDELVSFSQSDRGLFFHCDNYLIQGVKIDQNYPNYRAVIPTDTPIELSIGKSDLLASLRRISLYADLNLGAARLTCSEGKLTIKAQDTDFGKEAQEELNCEYSGDQFSIAFNAKILTSVVSNFDGDTITFNFSTPHKAALVADGSDLKGLVMPVMVTE
jgi:DNA polymerase-3 subunit beta